MLCLRGRYITLNQYINSLQSLRTISPLISVCVGGGGGGAGAVVAGEKGS